MTDTTIETKRFFKKSTIQLLKDKIKVVKSTAFESIEFEISYENIETKKTIESKVNFGLIVFILFLTITGFLFFLGDTSNISTVFFSLALFFLLIAFATKLKLITIRSVEGIHLELYFTETNKPDVIEFADKIISSANEYLLNKYSRIDKDMPIDIQLANLDFLRTKELLSEEKFEMLKNQLLGKENKQSIGYR